MRFLATANPSSILQLLDKANEHGEELIRDIRDGTLAGALNIEPAIRQQVQQRLRPNPGARPSSRPCAPDATAGWLPGDYWPELALIGCWKGGTVGHYLENFDEWFDPDGARPIAVRDWGYLSSEARGSIPLTDEAATACSPWPRIFSSSLT